MHGTNEGDTDEYSGNAQSKASEHQILPWKKRQTGISKQVERKRAAMQNESTMDEIESLKQRIRSAETKAVPEPWTSIGTIQLDGITDVGFAEDLELLLALTAHSREIIDCRTGRRIARDGSIEHQSSWYGRHDLIGHGFGPLHGRDVRLSGPAGGGLLAITPDGWGAMRLPIDWPEEFLVLVAPFASIHHPETPFWKIVTTQEPIAWGFSYSGKTLVAVTDQGVTLFGRP
jgi:hypothetical protein